MEEARSEDNSDTALGEVVEGDQSERPTTVPADYRISLRGFETEDHAKQFGNTLGVCVRELSRHIDLSNLDGITVAYDYPEALMDLDRGYETSRKLTPSSEMATGIAMTPAVIRDGKVKSHIVLDARVFIPLENPESEHFGLALHMLAHECAHVEVKQRFDTFFPGIVLQKKYENAHHALRWQIINACWDEYIVTRITASIGEDPTDGYEETLSLVLKETRAKSNDRIKAYRLHGNIVQVLSEVYDAYGDLMRFSSYLLGTMAGRRLTLSDLPRTATALDGHWFSRYFKKLGDAHSAIAADYGRWNDLSAFEALGDLADEIIADGGVIVSYRPDGQPYADIPFTPETMPNGDGIRSTATASAAE